MKYPNPYKADTGSWTLVSRCLMPYSRDGLEAWCGLSTDFDKLPHTGATGSTAYCIDTGARFMFERTTDTWYPMSSENGGTTLPAEMIPYVGSYTVTPAASEAQVLATANRFMTSDLTIDEIPYAETENSSLGKTVSIAAG